MSEGKLPCRYKEPLSPHRWKLSIEVLVTNLLNTMVLLNHIRIHHFFTNLHEFKLNIKLTNNFLPVIFHHFEV